MTTKHAKFLVSSLLLTACDTGPENVLVAAEALDSTEELGQTAVELDAPLGPDAHIGWTSDGRAAAVMNRDHKPLFVHAPGAEAAREALEGWLRGHADELGHAPADASERLTELELEQSIEVPTRAGRKLVVHRFVQRYRGHRIAGPGETLAVTSIDGAAISVMGALVDSRHELDGQAALMTRESAAAELERLAPETDLLELEFVAVPERGQMAWRGLVESRSESSLSHGGAREWLILSSDGDHLLERRAATAQSPFNHQPVHVVAQALTNDPQTSTLASSGWLPGSTWNGSWNFNTGWQLRMGDERALVLDLEFDNSSASVPLTPQYTWGMGGLYSLFPATPDTNPVLFNTQNLFHKLTLALDEIDAEKSIFGWAHAPGSPFGVFDPEPLHLLTNIDRPGSPDLCNGALGKFTRCTIGGPGLQLPYDNEEISCIYDCDQNPMTLMHELGHYIDQHSTYGLMGSVVNSGTCIHDTTDEAPALAETLSDITALALVRRLYPVGYTLSNTATPCTFAALGQGTSKIHDSSCMGFKHPGLGNFDVDRPSPSLIQSCTVSAGYRMPSVNQAMWAWLNRKVCNGTWPYTCSPSLGGEDLILPGIMYALSLSNAQSYKTFFENLETFIWANDGQAVADSFRAAMATYNILDP